MRNKSNSIRAFQCIIKKKKKIKKTIKNGIVSRHSEENTYLFRLGGVNNCKNVFSYFDKYTLYTRKSLSYKLWKDSHNDLVNKDHYEKYS